MIETNATIQNEHGIHCRPTAVIIKMIGIFEGSIYVETDGRSADPRSMLELMSLGLAKGTEITIRVDGPDEGLMLEKLKELFETNFDFDRDTVKE